jgi:hypothetical protein
MPRDTNLVMDSRLLKHGAQFWDWSDEDLEPSIPAVSDTIEDESRRNHVEEDMRFSEEDQDVIDGVSSHQLNDFGHKTHQKLNSKPSLASIHSNAPKVVLFESAQASSGNTKGSIRDYKRFMVYA